MTYTENKNPTGLSSLTSLANDDVLIVGDTSDTSEKVKKISKTDFLTDVSSDLTLTSVRGLVADDQSAATANATLIQAALVSAGNVLIDTPGDIYVDALDVTKGNPTVTIASPGVFTLVAHGLKYRDAVKFSTTGALPTGITADTVYYVTFGGLTADTFQVSATTSASGGTPINTSGTQSGTHTVMRREALKLYSNTHLTISPATTILPKDGANTGVFTNAATLSTPISIAGGVAGEMTWVTLADSSYGIRVDKTGIGNTFPVGSVISVVMTGHLLSADTHGYTQGFRGVWDVVLSSADSITYQIKRATPGSGSFAYPPIGATAYLADQNITITGGNIGGNGANQSIYTTGDPRGNVIWTSHAKNVTYEGINFSSRGMSWTIGSSYVRDYCVRNISGDVSGGSAGDMVHLVGQHQNINVDKIRAKIGDNMVGLTIDITDDTANTSNFTPGTGGASGPGLYNFPYQFPGDMSDVMVRDCYSINTPGFANCGIYGPGSYRYENIQYDNIGGEGGTLIQPANYPQTGMNNCKGTKLTVKNINNIGTGPQVIMSGVQTWDLLTFDNFSQASLTQECVKLDCTGTIGQVLINNITGTYRTSLRTNSLISVGAGTYGTIIVSNVENQKFQAGYNLFKHTGASTIGRLVFNNVSAIATTGGAANAVCAITAAGVADIIEFNSCALTSQGALGSILLLAATSNPSTVIFNNCRVSNGQGLIETLNTTNTIQVFMNNVILAGTNARAGQFAGPTNLFVNGYTELSAPTNNPFKLLTTAKAYNFKFVNTTTLKTDLIEFIGGANLRMQGHEARTALANVTAPTVGDLFYDVTGSNLKGRTSAPAWVNVF